MYKNLRKIEDLKLENKTVVVRANFDVPIKDSEVADNTRILSSIKTIEYLLKKNCKVVLISHLGRPNGEPNDDLSLMPVRFELGRLLNKPVKFAHIHACKNSIKFMEQGEVLLLENLRFAAGEESSNASERKEFVKELSELCDFYINDAFGVYREHASVFELAKMLPSAAGFGLQKELDNLEAIKLNPAKPYVVVLGGAKINTKIEYIKNLTKSADYMLLGGKLAYAFMAAQKISIGKVEIDKKEIKNATEIIKDAKNNKCEIILPVDHIGAEEFEENSKPVEIETQQIPNNLFGMDIGPKTLAAFREIIESAKTVLWNGPMGVFEWENFNKGTEAVGEYIALSTPKECFKIAGGGDTTYAMQLLKIKPKRFNLISIGGGMMLAYLANERFKVLETLTGSQNDVE